MVYLKIAWFLCHALFLYVFFLNVLIILFVCANNNIVARIVATEFTNMTILEVSLFVVTFLMNVASNLANYFKVSSYSPDNP
jgi:hypothetical protein